MIEVSLKDDILPFVKAKPRDEACNLLCTDS